MVLEDEIGNIFRQRKAMKWFESKAVKVRGNLKCLMRTQKKTELAPSAQCLEATGKENGI